MKTKRVFSVIFSFLLFLCVAVSSFIGVQIVSKKSVVTARAAEATSYSAADDIFSFSNGVTLNKADISEMKFVLNLKDPAFEKFDYRDKRTYYFTVYRVSADGTTSTAIVQYLFSAYQGVLMVAHKNLSYYNAENFFFAPEQKRGDWKDYDDYEADGYTYDYRIILTDSSDFEMLTGDTLKYLYLCVKANDPYTSYFVRFEYEIKDFLREETTGALLWQETKAVYDTYTGKIDSPQRSVYQWLNTASQVGILNSEFENYPESLSEATEILGNKDLKRIQVKYLSQIGETPFAASKTAYVEVPITSDEIPVDRIAAALSIKDFDVLGSSCYGFEYDSALDIYVAKYLKNVWLSAKTVDGNSANYFLDCNLSYQDYYYKMVTDEVFSEDLYQYIFSQILNNFPEVKGYTYDQVYGYFGYVVIPNTYSLNALWAEMFDTSTTFQGVTVKYQYTELLKYSSYRKLLDEYEYTWLEKAWNGVAGFVTGGSWSADHYLFYADIDATEAIIGENGADDIDDNDGAIKNGVEDGIEEAKNVLENFFGGLKEGLDNAANPVKIIGMIILLVLVVSLVVWIVDKIIPHRK